MRQLSLSLSSGLALRRRAALALLGASVVALLPVASASPPPDSTAASDSQAPPAYVLTDLGVDRVGTAINDRGDILEGALLVLRSGRVIDLDTLIPPPNYSTYVYALGASGDVAGTYMPSPGFEGVATVGFVYLHGKLQTIDKSYCFTNGINAWGQAVGYYGNDYRIQAFLRQPDGTFIDLPLPKDASYAYAINDLGQILASYVDPNSSIGLTHMVLTGPGGTAPKDLGNVGGDYSEPHALNDLGHAVGESNINDFGPFPTITHAFLYDGAKLRDLGALPGDGHAVGLALNNRGEIVGISEDLSRDPFRQRAWVYVHGRMYDLNEVVRPLPPGWTIEQANGINDFGKIVGNARVTTATGSELHGVLLRRVH